MAGLTVYYSDKCPHSLSLLELVTGFQTQYSKDNLQLINTQTRSVSTLPPEVVVVPTIVDRDGNFWAGDHAFERLRSLEVKSQGRASRGQLQQKGVGASDGGIELVRDDDDHALVEARTRQSLDPGAAEERANAASIAEDRKNAMQQSLFDSDVIMPRKN